MSKQFVVVDGELFISASVVADSTLIWQLRTDGKVITTGIGAGIASSAAVGLSPETIAEAEQKGAFLEQRLARIEQALSLPPLG